MGFQGFHVGEGGFFYLIDEIIYNSDWQFFMRAIWL